MIDPSEGEQAEKVYRSFEENLKELRYALMMLEKPMKILDMKRRAVEQRTAQFNLTLSMESDGKLHHQKIGRDELMDDLWAMTKPLAPQIPDNTQADYKPENELT